VRSVSGLTTIGLANPVVATAELAGAAGVSILAIVAPLVALAVMVAMVWWLLRRRSRSRRAQLQGWDSAEVVETGTPLV
jgi:hypothetical protein